MNCTWEEVEGFKEGDIISFEGHEWLLLKKTKTAVALKRYRWYDKLIAVATGRTRG